MNFLIKNRALKAERLFRIKYLAEHFPEVLNKALYQSHKRAVEEDVDTVCFGPEAIRVEKIMQEEIAKAWESLTS